MEDKNSLAPVFKHFRAKVSPYLGRLMKSSEAVAKQFLPVREEIVPYGTDTPFEEGKNNHGIYGLERIYQDRAVLTPYFECLAYCRYCFKKTRTLAGDAKRMSDQNIGEAIQYISQDERIKTVLITGGDPFVDPPLLFKILDQVVKIPHVNFIRVGTRNILFAPHAITDALVEQLAQYNTVDPYRLDRSKNLSIGLSLNHVEELTPEVIAATRKFIGRGVTVRGQTVLLKGINDSVEALQKLIGGFLAIGIVPYYLFHCMPVTGVRHFRTPVQKGLDILEKLLPFSGTTAPIYVYVTRVGKIRLMPGTPLHTIMVNGARYIKATTPYKTRDFLEFSDKKLLPPLHETNEEGHIVSHYLDGDENE